MSDKLQIAPPAADRPPLKVNVFRFVQNSVSALSPIFPYVDEGAIVPCAATFRGGPGVSFGRFQHFNTVDEVAIILGSRGGQYRATGVVRVGPKLHMVQAPLDDPADPEAVRVVVITQRQLYGQPHREEFRFVCEKCDRRLFLHQADATPPKRGAHAGQAPFISIAETYEAARRFNADDAARTCQHCGHVNPKFPIESWGLESHVRQSAIADVGHAALTQAQQAMKAMAAGAGAPIATRG